MRALAAECKDAVDTSSNQWVQRGVVHDDDVPSLDWCGVIPASELGLKATSELSSASSDGTAFGLYSSSVKHLTVQDRDIRIVAEPPDRVASLATVE